jgi:transcription antitermination factor NusG
MPTRRTAGRANEPEQRFWQQDRIEVKRGGREMRDLETTEGAAATAWWALYTRHQHEKVVADMLLAKGFEVFLPVYESIRRWKDRRKVLSLPLFPCYVFVRGGLDRRLQVVTTPGIHMILTHGDRVALIPEAEIAGIRRSVEGHYRVEPHPFLRCGERVRVRCGSLQGVEGILVRKKSLYRLVLSVDMLAQSVAVEIDASDVDPVTSPETAGTLVAGASEAGSAWGLGLRKPDSATAAG